MVIVTKVNKNFTYSKSRYTTTTIHIGIFAISFTFGQGDRRNVNMTGKAGSLREDLRSLNFSISAEFMACHNEE